MRGSGFPLHAVAGVAGVASVAREPVGTGKAAGVVPRLPRPRDRATTYLLLVVHDLVVCLHHIRLGLGRGGLALSPARRSTLARAAGLLALVQRRAGRGVGGVELVERSPDPGRLAGPERLLAGFHCG